MKTYILLFIFLSMYLNVAGAAEDVERVWLVKDGKAAADVYASASEWGQAEKLVNRINEWTGVKLLILSNSYEKNFRNDMTKLAIGTEKTIPILSRTLAKDKKYQKLNEQGYLIRVTAIPSVILVAGKTSSSTMYGVGELLNYRLKVEKKNVWCEPFEIAEEPVLPYRWFWVSTTMNHWDAEYGGPHITDDTTRNIGLHPDGSAISTTKYPGQFMGSHAYIRTYKAQIDWMAEHKLNGLISFGFLCEGVDNARQVARYGKDRGVDIMPGFGTMCYWGAYYGGYNDQNLDTIMNLRPEIKTKTVAGGETVCPSSPGMQAYWRKSGEWIMHAIPELGGLNLEYGDLIKCGCDVCKANRAKKANDTGCYYDMMASGVPAVKGASSVKSDGLYSYATYTSFITKSDIKEGSGGQWGDRDIGTSWVPPRFPKQFPSNAICQWTLTGLDESTWPEGYKAAASHNVGLFHSPSVWGAPDGTDRWWAKPGSSHDDASRLVKFYCSRMATSNFEGLILKGMINNHSPGPLLSYLALGEFSWHPEMTIKEWEENRLSQLFGGPERTKIYLDLLRDSSRDAARRQEMVQQAQKILQAADLSPRAVPYWQDLVEELNYRIRLLEGITAKEASGK